ncbi:unnamed protein product [Ectocarpus sp. CCAP 1310/34]|nr:unnamed protein product [Ectocarpus sp. CCAP 1310/34]
MKHSTLHPSPALVRNVGPRYSRRGSRWRGILLRRGAVEEAARKGATQGKETGPQAQQQQLPQGSHASTASDAKLGKEGFGLRHMEEAMLRSMEESKQDGGRNPQQGKVS